MRAPSGPGPGRAGCPVMGVRVHWAEQLETAARPQSPPRVPASRVGRDLRKASPWWVPRLGQSQLQPGGAVGQGRDWFP